MLKKTIIATCLLAVMGGGVYVGYSEHQKVEGYQHFLSKQYVNDYSQLAGHINSSQGYLSMILKNKEMAVEEQQSLVQGLYGVAHVLDQYNQLKEDTKKGLEVSSNAFGSQPILMGIASYIAQLEPEKPLKPEQLEKLQVAHDLLKVWNESIVEEIPELNAEKETYQVFMDKYSNDGIKGQEWLNVLESLDKKALKFGKDKELDLMEAFPRP